MPPSENSLNEAMVSSYTIAFELTPCWVVDTTDTSRRRHLAVGGLASSDNTVETVLRVWLLLMTMMAAQNGAKAEASFIMW